MPYTYSGISHLFGTAQAPPEQAVAFILHVDTGSYTARAIREVIIPAYVAEAGKVGLDWLLLVAQLIKETGNLTSFWASRPRRNPAGIGVTGAKRVQRTPPDDGGHWAYNSDKQRWEEGVSFDSWNVAVPAHVGRMVAYCLTDAQCNPAQHAAVDAALRYRPLANALRGHVTVLNHLDGIWATPGVGYGQSIANLANAICAYSS